MTWRRTQDATTVGVLVVLLLAVLYCHGRGWIGGPFPGFFVFADRAVPLPALPGHLDALEQQQVLAVDGATTAPSADPYQGIGGPGLGTAFLNPAPATGGAVALPAFDLADHLLIFCATAVNALFCLIIGLVVLRARPGEAAARALFAATTTAAVFLVTEPALFLPQWCFRLNALAQAILPATLLHLALVFPADRLGARRLPLLCIYLPFVALAGVYQLALEQAAEYAALQLIARVALALGGAALAGIFYHAVCYSPFPLARRRAAVAALGALGGLLAPLFLVAGSALPGAATGGSPITLTAFLFPLAMGYAIVKQDLFEIDEALRRGVTYAVLALPLLGLQLAALSGARHAGWLETGPGTPAVVLLGLSLGLVFVLHLLREPVGQRVDRVLLGRPYSSEHSLMKLINSLAGARTVDAVVRSVQEVLLFTFHPALIGVFLREQRGGFYPAGGGEAAARPIALTAGILDDLMHGRAVSCHRWVDGSASAAGRFWPEPRTEMLVPMQIGGSTVGLLALGRRQSGGFYNGDDVRFLRMVASQAALAFAGASAFRALKEINASLERQVEERAAAMSAANAELNAANAQLKGSLAELQHAYDQLEQNHACLLRAERLATLGRLSAGIAHEVNTPLSAVQNALRVLCELGHEYASSIDDATVLPADHHEIAREIVTTAQSASEWAQKAALFIRSTKAHGRNPAVAAAEPFSVGALAVEVRDLLMHRLRAAGRQLLVEEAGGEVSIVGSRAAFSQVLLNLITNALDAYEDAGIAEGRIVVAVSRSDDTATVEVQDWAGGIPLQILPRIFEEMFTTKGAGRGTGLGLWISRTIVEKEFGGQLDVLTSPGQGSRFIATIPCLPATPDAQSGAIPVRSAA